MGQKETEDRAGGGRPARLGAIGGHCVCGGALAWRRGGGGVEGWRSFDGGVKLIFFAFYPCTNVQANLRKRKPDRSLGTYSCRPLNPCSRGRRAAGPTLAAFSVPSVASLIPTHTAEPARCGAAALSGRSPAHGGWSSRCSRARWCKPASGTWACRWCTGSVAAVREDHGRGALSGRQQVTLQGTRGLAGGTVLLSRQGSTHLAPYTPFPPPFRRSPVSDLRH
jgi:hypothetical protein